MDILEATVPEDAREDLVKSIHERDEDLESEPAKKRPRSNTKTLLSPEGELAEVIEPPPFEQDLSKYTRERVKAGLQYITYTTASRKITPRTMTFLNMSKDAHKLALDCETISETAVAVIQQYDKIYHSQSFLLHPRSTQELEQMSNFTKLRRIQLLANYGDYCGQKFRADVKELGKADDEVGRAAIALGPPKAWSDIADELKSVDVSQLRGHVDVACGRLNLDVKYMCGLIDQWGQRNRQFHNEVRELIKECKWSKLADQIHMDLQDILNIEYDQEIVALFRRVIIETRDLYFDLDRPMDPPFQWVRSEYARKLGIQKSEAEAAKQTKRKR